MRDRRLPTSIALLLEGVAGERALADAHSGSSVGSADTEDQSDTSFEVFCGYRGANFQTAVANHGLVKLSRNA